MKTILVLGAGRSATSLIEYLIKNSMENDWVIRVGDYDESIAREKCHNSSRAEAFQFDINHPEQCSVEVGKADLVISMLPAAYHPMVARQCLSHGVHLLTASYVSDEMRSLDREAKEKGILLLNECGLDPGVDHMSAMRVIDKIRSDGHELIGFESFTGGLLAPNERADNPWDYKFTWNPRNVVLAGQGIVKFIQEGTYKYIPYQRLFRRTEIVHIPGYGHFEGYANRDSLKYLDVYGLRGIRTIYRGTFRRPGFCRTWDIFVQLGATDDAYYMEGVGEMTHRSFINSFLSYNPHDSVELKLAHYMRLELDGPEMHRLRWLGLFDETPVGLDKGTPAQVLEHILKKKWTLDPDDRDMIVMWHKFDFMDSGKHREIHSTMVAIGDDPVNTAMSKTVGLPLGMAARHILNGNIRLRGVQIPIVQEIYDPILKELVEEGIELVEKEIE
ncbi:saccharopine dehydrogenase family protein [Fulvivirga sedimenti]|uniref:Saccharopine dehydrogenase NADP-binding domain-containing protein n=1 Tax=Fulvivirga sedimenti TaxID=2879465 RepID=A0A9X1L195_9BACT|nr:saccharopine dehydrogenase C-terminal domain-containing protein [Fulvivirga sedimenti]MCA6077987.1 saccharopine dehydrogenase NADP-binding domain-containing protein [Fulvivirga sedimenti]